MSIQFDRASISRDVAIGSDGGQAAFVETCELCDESDRLLLFGSRITTKLTPKIAVYADRDKQNLVMRIEARGMRAASVTYDVLDVQSSDGEDGVKIGALRGRSGGWKFARDVWEILDEGDNPIGQAELLGGWLARFFSSSLNYEIHVRGARVGGFQQTKSIPRFEARVDFEADPERSFDRRMRAALALALAAFGRGR